MMSWSGLPGGGVWVSDPSLPKFLIAEVKVRPDQSSCRRSVILYCILVVEVVVRGPLTQ
ncbi:MAG: hypothetical protein ACI8TP_004423 [Acidimicrobiales bacterium]|jgi:hypothetical protein